MGFQPCTIHSPSGVGSVVTKSLPAVSILTLVESVDGQLVTRRGLLDQDDKLLIHKSSGRLDQQLHNTLLPVHHELSRQIKYSIIPSNVCVCEHQPDISGGLQLKMNETHCVILLSCTNNFLNMSFTERVQIYFRHVKTKQNKKLNWFHK